MFKFSKRTDDSTAAGMQRCQTDFACCTASDHEEYFTLSFYSDSEHEDVVLCRIDPASPNPEPPKMPSSKEISLAFRNMKIKGMRSAFRREKRSRNLKKWQIRKKYKRLKGYSEQKSSKERK